MHRTPIALALLAALPALAQPEPPAPAQPAAPERELPVAPRKRERYPAATRMDLAIAYLRFERALRDHPPPGERIAEYNRRFDEASIAFFTGRFNPAVESLSAMVRELEGRGADAARTAAESLRVTPTSVVVHAGNAAGAALTLEPLFVLAGVAAGPVSLDLVLIDAAGKECWRRPMEVAVIAGRPADLRIDLGPLFATMPRGDFTLALAPPAGAPAPFSLGKGRLTLREASVEPVQRELDEVLLAVKPATPEQTRAFTTARARVALLSDEGSTRNSASFLAGMDGLAAAAAAEVRAVAKGENPYRGLAGDHWRVIAVDGAEVPCRVHASPKVAASAEAVPLLIAFHGAGGDESMFLEGYGAGLIRDLADEKGFLVACPLTYSGSSNRAFDRLVEDLSGDYRVDPRRIYVLGHSMGAGAAAGLASGRPGAVAAACCMAGGGLGSAKAGVRRVPTLVVAAELDPLFGIARARKAAQDAAAAGGANAPGFIEARGWGHTLVVGSHLRGAVEWLLERRLE